MNDRDLVWEKPIAFTRYWYEGPMYGFNNRYVNLFITPNHNIYWRNGHSNQYRLSVDRPEIEFSLSEVNNIGCWTHIEFKRNAEWHCAVTNAILLN